MTPQTTFARSQCVFPERFGLDHVTTSHGRDRFCGISTDISTDASLPLSKAASVLSRVF